MTVKELFNIYEQVDHCKKGYCCYQEAENKTLSDLLFLGSNFGLHGWNWSAYLDRETNTLYISHFGNIPNYIKEK